MVGPWRAAREDPFLASEALLALQGITEPTQLQRIGALIDAEFKLRVIHLFRKKD